MDVWIVDVWLLHVAMEGGDMERGEKGAEKVVESDLEGVHPLLAVVQLEGWVLFWSFGEGEG